MDDKINLFLKTLNLEIRNRELIKTALTHRSHKGKNNERLEFLGDAVIELLVSVYLYNRFSNEKEGILTKYRSAMVKTSNLAKIAKNINLGEFVDISKNATKIIEENISKTNLKDKSEIHTIPAEIYVKKNKHIKKFDIIFVFQPYNKTDNNILKNAKNMLKDKGIIVFEKEKNKNIKNIHGLKLVDQRTYGKTSILFYILNYKPI